MRVLVSVYACEPGRGSEPEVGLRTVLASASEHETWVLTRENNLPVLSAFLSDHPLRNSIRLVGLDLEGTSAQRFKRRGVVGLQWYYDRWQRRAGEVAQELDAQHDFDVVHHATFAAYWARAGVSVVAKPLVWGPVGGGAEPPFPLLSELGVRGLLEDAARIAVRRTLARARRTKTTIDKAAVILAQNSDTAARLEPSRATVVPNGSAVELPLLRHKSRARSADVLMVGRQIPLKAGHLAISSMRYLRHPTAALVVYGDGPEIRRMSRAARRWGLLPRVHFAGQVARDVLLSHVATAGAVLHPALHDESGLSVAEALSLGTPLVCLDHAGPAELVRCWPESPSTAVHPDMPRATAKALAAAVDHHLASPPPVLHEPKRPARSYAEAVLSAYESAAQSGSYDGRVG